MHLLPHVPLLENLTLSYNLTDAPSPYYAPSEAASDEAGYEGSQNDGADADEFARAGQDSAAAAAVVGKNHRQRTDYSLLPYYINPVSAPSFRALRKLDLRLLSISPASALTRAFTAFPNPTPKCKHHHAPHPVTTAVASLKHLSTLEDLSLTVGKLEVTFLASLADALSDVRGFRSLGIEVCAGGWVGVEGEDGDIDEGDGVYWGLRDGLLWGADIVSPSCRPRATGTTDQIARHCPSYRKRSPVLCRPWPICARSRRPTRTQPSPEQSASLRFSAVTVRRRFLRRLSGCGRYSLPSTFRRRPRRSADISRASNVFAGSLAAYVRLAMTTTSLVVVAGAVAKVAAVKRSSFATSSGQRTAEAYGALWRRPSARHHRPRGHPHASWSPACCRGSQASCADPVRGVTNQWPSFRPAERRTVPSLKTSPASSTLHAGAAFPAAMHNPCRISSTVSANQTVLSRLKKRPTRHRARFVDAACPRCSSIPSG